MHRRCLRFSQQLHSSVVVTACLVSLLGKGGGGCSVVLGLYYMCCVVEMLVPWRWIVVLVYWLYSLVGWAVKPGSSVTALRSVWTVSKYSINLVIHSCRLGSLRKNKQFLPGAPRPVLAQVQESGSSTVLCLSDNAFSVSLCFFTEMPAGRMSKIKSVVNSVS